MLNPTRVNIQKEKKTVFCFHEVKSDYLLIIVERAVDEILNYGYSCESHCAALSCVPVYYAVQGGSKF